MYSELRMLKCSCGIFIRALLEWSNKFNIQHEIFSSIKITAPSENLKKKIFKIIKQRTNNRHEPKIY